VVWAKTFSESGVWARRLDDDAAFQVSAVNSQQYTPAISGDIVVWSDNRNGQYDIYGKNLLTGLEFPIAVDPGDKWCPAIDGNLVVWHRFLGGRLDIWGTVIPEPAKGGTEGNQHGKRGQERMALPCVVRCSWG